MLKLPAGYHLVVVRVSSLMVEHLFDRDADARQGGRRLVVSGG
jgi:hypothetical protein